MISLYGQRDYSHHSSAQWKPWEALCCLSGSHHIHGRESRVKPIKSKISVEFLGNLAAMTTMHFLIFQSQNQYDFAED